MTDASRKPDDLKAPARRLTVKQERFAQSFVALGSAAEAYRRAYDAADMARKSVHEAASRLLRNGKVAARIREIREHTAQDYGITRMALLLELDEAFVMAKSNRKAPAMIAATMAKARLTGFDDHVPALIADRPPLSLPPLADLLGTHDSVIAAMAAGKIGVREVHAFVGLLDCRRRLVETAEFEKRLATIEARLHDQDTNRIGGK